MTNSTNSKDHIRVEIDANVDEEELMALFESNGHIKHGVNGQFHDSDRCECPVLLHPSSHKAHCGKSCYSVLSDSCDLLVRLSLEFTHIIGGQVQSAPIERQGCDSMLIIFAPVDSKIRKAIVIPKRPHNHPSFRFVKVTCEDRDFVNKAIRAAGGSFIRPLDLKHGRL